MADKEVTLFVVDVGQATGRLHANGEETELQFAARYLYDKIATMISGARKTVKAGVIAFNTDRTKNPLAGNGDEGFEHISVFREIDQLNLAALQDLQALVTPSNTDAGDAVSAVVLAVHVLSSYLRTQKWIRRIILITNAAGEIEDNNDTPQIAEQCKSANIQLIVLGPDKASSDAVELRLALLKDLAEQCGGIYGTIGQAVAELAIPRLKVKRGVPTYRGTLNLGSPEEFDSAMTIDVERYIKTMIERPPTASTFVLAGKKEATGEGEEDKTRGGEYSNVRTQRQYHVPDTSAPDGKRIISADELTRGYEYGRTAVAVQESDQGVTKLETRKSLDIVGFIPRESHDHYMDMSRTSVIIAQRFNEKAVMALSSFIHTLFETDNYAIARIVTKDGNAPELLMLAPCIEPDFECLIDVAIPFAEDVRPYKFPPLDRVNTLSGKVLTVHRHLPSKELQDAMAQYIDAMDLLELGEDDDGNPSEYAAMEDTYSPALHRINQAIRERAIDPNSSTTKPAEILVKYSRAPGALLDRAESEIATLAKCADVKQVPPKQLRKNKKEPRKVEDDSIDIQDLLRDRLVDNEMRIDPNNAKAEFISFLNVAKDDDEVHSAFTQFGDIIKDWVARGIGSMNDDRVIEGLETFRDQSREYEFENEFDDFIRDFKAKIETESLGGDRRELWWKIRKADISPSKGNEQENREFWRLEKPQSK